VSTSPGVLVVNSAPLAVNLAARPIHHPNSPSFLLQLNTAFSSSAAIGTASSESASSGSSLVAELELVTKLGARGALLLVVICPS
jgi:hypothetical protein